MNPFSIHIDIDNLLNRIYWLLLIRAEPLEHPDMLERSIVLPLTQRKSIHPWPLLPQATWDDIITFIHSSLTSDELHLLIHDCLISRIINKLWVFMYAVELTLYAPDEGRKRLTRWWKHLVILNIINALLQRECRLQLDNLDKMWSNFKIMYHAVPSSHVINFPLINAHFTIRSQVLSMIP